MSELEPTRTYSNPTANDILRRMLDEQLAEGKPEELTISCHFCGNSYCFTPEHLEKLF